MKILMWSGSYAPGIGGVEILVGGLVRSLASGGHDVRVVTQSAVDESRLEDAPDAVIHRLPFHQVLSSRDPARVAALTEEVERLLGSFAPDVVHVHAIHPSAFFLLRASRKRGWPTIFTLHGWTPLTAGEDTLRTRMLRNADWVTGCGRHVTDRAIMEAPAIASRSSSISTGCADPGVPIANLPFDPPRILYVGRLVASKGVDTLIAALPLVLERAPAARLRIVGGGPLREDLEQLASALGVAHATEFTGAVPRQQIFAHLNASTVLVIASREGSEALPLVALEAALMERPVVATPDGGIPEVVVDGQTGFLVQDDNPTSVAEAILNVFQDRAIAIALGRAGRQRVLARFTWDAHVAAYLRLYQRVSGGNTST